MEGWTAGGGLPRKKDSRPKVAPSNTTGSSAMEVRVDQITTSPTHLYLGCVVVGPERAWVRFCKVRIPLSAIPTEDISRILMRDQDGAREIEEDDPLF